MENKEKYFIPEESDLRLGYEYETNFNGENKWKKKIVTDLGCESDGCGELQDLLTLINYHNSDLLDYQLNYANRVRVPFLTKEQIENEGWKKTWENINDIDDNENCGYELSSKDNLWNIVFESNNENMLIFKNNEGSHYFNGKIKSINEFRTIMKFLEI